MRINCLLFILVLNVICFSLAAQEPFVKLINVTHNTVRVQVRALADGDIAILARDSGTLYRLSSCGALKWAKKFDLPFFNTGNSNWLVTPTGGFAFINRVQKNDANLTAFTLLDASGEVILSQTLEDNLYTHSPYTLRTDEAGNFYIFGNLSPIGGGRPFSNLVKLSPSGSLIWSRFYNHGYIWGGVTLTSDSGFLARNGSIFFKLDKNGEPQWTHLFNVQSRDYNPAIEVADGYVFNAGNNNKFELIKMTKDGEVSTAGRRRFSFSNFQTTMIAKPNGNLLMAQLISIKNGYMPSIIELDKDLNVVSRSVIRIHNLNGNLHPFDIDIQQDLSVLISGLLIPNLPGISSKPFLVKTNAAMHTNCDSTFSFTDTTLPVVRIVQSTSSFSHDWTLKPHQFQVSDFTAGLTTICGPANPSVLDLGKDSVLCDGDSIRLTNQSASAFDQFQWSGGQNGKTISVSKPGAYWLKAINQCRQDTVSDTIYIKSIDIPHTRLSADTQLCFKGPIQLRANIPDAKYQWQDGSTDSVLWVNETGKYYVDIQKKHCQKRSEIEISECEILIMPNLFTPNADKTNDRLEPILMRGIASATMEVYNRWGQKIFVTNDILNEGWTGEGKPNGIYFWYIAYINHAGKTGKQYGYVSLAGDKT